LAPDPRRKKQKKDDEFRNIIYSCRTIKGVPEYDGIFLIGAEDKNVSKIKIDYENVDIIDLYSGHSMGIRSIELSKDASTMITGCEDHSLRVWDFKTGKSKCILSGHHDVVVSKLALCDYLDGRLLVEQQYHRQ